MKTIDIQGLKQVLRWNYLDNRTKAVRQALIFSLIFSLICLLVQYNTESVQNEKFDCFKEAIMDNYMGNLTGMWGFTCFFAFFFMASSIFLNMRTKQMRAIYLLLPAGNLEKFLGRLIYITSSTVITLLGSLFITDAIQFLFSFILTPGLHGSLTAHIVSGMFQDNNLNNVMIKVGSETVIGEHVFVGLSVFSLILWGHSYFTLGGTYFRKHPILLSIVSFYILAFVIGGILSWTNYNFIIGTVDNGVTEMTKNDVRIILYIITIINFVLSFFNYWLSYKIFCRMQIISNKWTNI